MTTLFSALSFEVSTSEPVSPKTAHLLRTELARALEEAASGVLDAFGIPNENARTIHVDPIEVTHEEAPVEALD